MWSVESTNLSYLYPAGRGITDITLRVAPGEIVGLLGPNGSGKSTLLKTVIGLLRPVTGELRLFGQPIPPVPANIRRRVGVLFDSPAHFDDLTGWENAFFFARAYGLVPGEIRERLAELFERFELAEHAHDVVADYSYGMRRKLALVETLTHAPDLLLLDEPGIGLDYAARVALAETLREHAEQGTAIILATNDVAEAEHLCDRVVFLHQGRIAACDTPAALLARLDGSQEIVLQLAAPVDLTRLQALADVMLVSADADARVHVLGRNGTLDIADIVGAVTTAGGQILALNVQAPTLGDVFLALTGERLDATRNTHHTPRDTHEP